MLMTSKYSCHHTYDMMGLDSDIIGHDHSVQFGDGSLVLREAGAALVKRHAVSSVMYFVRTLRLLSQAFAGKVRSLF